VNFFKFPSMTASLHRVLWLADHKNLIIVLYWPYIITFGWVRKKLFCSWNTSLRIIFLPLYRFCPRLNKKSQTYGKIRPSEDETDASRTCQRCGDVFYSKYTLKRHVSLHSFLNCNANILRSWFIKVFSI
jgi:hypothetical protein